MRYILAALATLTALLTVSMLAATLTPATALLALLMLGAAGMFACLALFTETPAPVTAPVAADKAGDLLVPNETPAADVDGTAHLLDMMEATAATINPTNPDLFIYRPALNGGTRWTATLNDTYNRVITTVTGNTETPGTVDVTHYYRELGKSDHVKNANALRVAWELEMDLPNIAAYA